MRQFNLGIVISALTFLALFIDVKVPLGIAKLSFFDILMISFLGYMV